LKDLKFTELYEIYGKLLTKKQQVYMDKYFLRDLSLNEIAEICKVSRQTVKDSLDFSKKLLLTYEKTLKLHQKIEKISKLIDDSQIIEILRG